MRNRKEKNICGIAVLILAAALLAGCGAEKTAEGAPENVREAAQEDGKTEDAKTEAGSGQAAAESIDVTASGEEDGFFDPDAAYTEAEFVCDLTTDFLGPYINMDLAPYIVHVDDDSRKDTVLDRNGKELFHTGYEDENESHYWYLFDNEVLALKKENVQKDGYFVATVTLFDSKGNVLIETASYESNYYYVDGIFYHMVGTKDDDPRKIAAYDLKEGKELWQIEGDEPIVLENGILCMRQKPYSDYHNRIVIAKPEAGKLYADECNGIEVKIGEGAVGLVNGTEVEIYDFNGNKTATYTCKRDDTSREYFERILDTGAFVIGDGKNESCTFYSKNGNLITSLDTSYLKTYPQFPIPLNRTTARCRRERRKQSSPAYSIVCDNKHQYYAFFDDDSWICIGKNYEDDPEVKYGCFSAYVEEEGKSLDEEKVKLVNMRTKQEHVFEEPVDTKFYTPEGCTYYIMHGSYKSGAKEYYVYDKDFNLIYETEAHLEPVNNRCFLETDEDKLTLIDIETMERHPLNTEGKFSECSETHLTTWGEDGIMHVYRLK